jgi:hypothetical protein
MSLSVVFALALNLHYRKSTLHWRHRRILCALSACNRTQKKESRSSPYNDPMIVYCARVCMMRTMASLVAPSRPFESKPKLSSSSRRSSFFDGPDSRFAVGLAFATYTPSRTSLERTERTDFSTEAAMVSTSTPFW